MSEKSLTILGAIAGVLLVLTVIVGGDIIRVITHGTDCSSFSTWTAAGKTAKKRDRVVWSAQLAGQRKNPVPASFARLRPCFATCFYRDEVSIFVV